MKTYKYIFLLSCLLFSACTQDNEWLNENTESTPKGTVYLNLQSAEIDVSTRSTTPQDPLTDNPMYDLYLLHYSFEGQLIEQKSISFNQAELSYAWNPSLTIDQHERKETICLIANMKGHYPTWPSRLADLKETCVDLQFGTIDNESKIETGLIAPKKMYMFGYYEGVIKSNQSINIMMGRMAAALKFVITASNSNQYTYKINSIEIIKAPRQSYFYPHKSTDSNFGSNIVEKFSKNNVINSSTPELTFYYQIGENISPSDANRTKIKINATYGNSTKDYTVVLGCDAPGTENRNYSLYRNNNYTFNINLK